MPACQPSRAQPKGQYSPRFERHHQSRIPHTGTQHPIPQLVPRPRSCASRTDFSNLDRGPFRFEAAILSRIRSEVTSRSNWAKDRSTLRVSRPMEVVVLNCWVTETKDTPWASNSSTSLAKSASDLVRRSTL